MTKKKSKIKFTLVAILLAIGIILCGISFNIPFTSNTFAGFFNAITATNDISDGLSAVYEMSSDEGVLYDETVEETMNLIRKILNEQGFSQSKVMREGSDKIRVEAQALSNGQTLLKILGEQAVTHIRGTKTTELADTDITKEEIVSVSVENRQTGTAEFSFGVNINFNAEGKKKLASMTSSGSGSVYIYLTNSKDEEPIAINYSSQINQDYMFISGGNIVDEASAKEYALKIMMGTSALNLEILENNSISPLLGLNVVLFLLIALLVIIILAFVLMWLFYGDFGLLANFSILFAIVFNIFFLQAVPGMNYSLSGFIGTIVSLCLMFICHGVYFNSIKKEYALGRKIHLATKNGFNNTKIKILDLCIIPILVAIGCVITGIQSLQVFAYSLFIGSIITAFCSLVLTRGLLKWYLPLNSENASHLRLTREVAANDEE